MADGVLKFIMVHPPRKGFTGVLRGRYRFQNGVCRLRATDVSAGTERVLRSLGAVREGLEGTYGAEADAQKDGTDGTVSSMEGNADPGRSPEGSSDEGDGDAGAEAGSEGTGTSGDAGPEGSAPEVNVRLQRAVASLDAENDDHWTQAGKPALEAVAKAYGNAAVTRAEVEAAAPGYVREDARNAEGDDA